MGDNSEYRLLSISIRKPPKYGSILSKDLTQRKNYLIHNVQKDETLQGIALKYNVSMEKIKRANNLWTSDSLFLRPTLSIPIDKPKIEEDCLNNGEFMNGNYHNLDSKSLNNNSSSTHLNGSLNINTNSYSAISSTSTNNEHNNNVDYKISLNEIKPDIQLDQQPSTSGSQTNGNSLTQSNGSSNELLSRDESMDDFLSRIDQYIKQSKVKIDSFANSSEIISSQSDDDLFKLHKYGSKSTQNYRQHSLRNNDISLHQIRDRPHNHADREIIYSLRKLEKEQEEREKFDL